ADGTAPGALAETGGTEIDAPEETDGSELGALAASDGGTLGAFADPGGDDIGGYDHDVYKTLGFTVNTDDVADQIANGDTPTRAEPFALSTIPELAVFTGADSSNDNRIYDVSEVGPGPSYDQLRIITTGNLYDTRSVAFDPDGDGRKEYIAQVFTSKGGGNTMLYLRVYNGETGEVTPMQFLSQYPFELPAHSAGAFLSITAGDYDGDNKDEIAVYSPNWPNAPCVIVYEFDPVAKTLTAAPPVIATEEIPDVGYLYEGALSLDILGLGSLSIFDVKLTIHNGVNAIHEIDVDLGSGAWTGALIAGVSGNQVTFNLPFGGSQYPMTMTLPFNVDVVEDSPGNYKCVSISYEISGTGRRYITGWGGLAYINDYTCLTPGQYYNNSKMYEYFSVNLATIPAAGNAPDAIAVASSYIRDAHKTDSNNSTTKNARNRKSDDAFLGVWYNPLGANSRVTVDNLKENWAEAYGSGYSSRYEYMMFPSVTAGDIDGDGIPEVIVAGYRLANANSSSLDDRDIDQKRFLITYYAFDGEKFSKAAPFQWVALDTNRSVINLGAGIHNNPNETDWARNPFAMTVFRERGTGYNNSVFVGGYVLALPTIDPSGESLDAQEFSMGMYGGYDSMPDSNNMAPPVLQEKTFRIRYFMPLASRDDNNNTRKAVAEAVSGNFIGDPEDREQVIFTYITKDYGDNTNRHYGDLCYFSYKGMATAAVSSPFSGGAYMFDAQRRFGQGPSSGSQGSTLTGLSVAAPDVDYDSVIVKYDSSTPPDWYFTDPQVMAVLQAAPYFAELPYDGAPDTTMINTSGVTQSSSHAVEISAGFSVGFHVGLSAGIVDVFAVDITAGVHGSGGWAHDNEWSHSTSRSFSTGSADTVVLAMTPYVRYHYLQWIPEEDDWLPMPLDVPMTPRTSQISVDSYDKVAAANGWRTLRDGALGDSIAGDPTTYSPDEPPTWNLYDKGQNREYAKNQWVGVGTGTGAQTVTISHERSSSHGGTWGVGIHANVAVNILVATGSVQGAIDYRGGYMWGTFNAADYEGTVPNIPDEHVGLYDFEWEFGTYMVDVFPDDLDKDMNKWLGVTDQDRLRKIADEMGLDTLVLGYCVRGVQRPPFIPEPGLDGVTQDSASVVWDRLRGDYATGSYGVHSYEVARIGATGNKMEIGRVAADASAAYRFTEDELAPGKLYQYAMRAWGSTVPGM
ncbi:MAG: FG-GAP-like repeat-containing protein, partial [Oscillospiraceae bacterium]|nr:FG-GAP-like repeat-containing protein [Oscillospiraceae bacterium]